MFSHKASETVQLRLLHFGQIGLSRFRAPRFHILTSAHVEGNGRGPGKTKGGSMGLSYPTLTRVNYIVWAMKMKVLMQAHGIWDVIEKEDPKNL
ncbi:hypothetical protein AgCh_014633 [Apium graveolens]